MVFSKSEVVNTPGTYLVDSDGILDVYCGEKGDDESNMYRGLVYHNETLVSPSMHFTIDFNQDIDHEDIEHLLGDIGDYRICDSQEGTIIRMFYFADKWYTTTHRKLNAHTSRWSSRETFGDIFDRLVLAKTGLDSNEFRLTLDVDLQYIFLIRNTCDNRIVCDSEERVYHLETHMGISVDDIEDIDLGLDKITPRDFVNFKEVVDYVKDDDFDYMKSQGVIIVNKLTGMQYKLLNPRYTELSNVRSNEPSLRFRYLNVIKDEKINSALRKLYPDSVHVFDKCDSILKQLSEELLADYVTIYIHKKFKWVDSTFHSILKKYRLKHLKSRKLATAEELHEMIMSSSPVILNRLIRLKYSD